LGIEPESGPNLTPLTSWMLCVCVCASLRTGLYEPKWISSFPYNCIPHPMIVGAMVGLSGVYKMAGMRAAMPYLVPGHIALYACHMAQEMIWDVYRTPAPKIAKKVQ
jgi:hypothetical protein